MSIYGVDENVYFGNFMNPPEGFESLNEEEKNNYEDSNKNKEESKMYSFGLNGGSLLNIDKIIDEGYFSEFMKKYKIDPTKVKLSALSDNVESYNLGLDEIGLKDMLKNSPKIYEEIEKNSSNGCVPTDTAVFGQQDEFDNNQIVCGFISAIYSEERDKLLILSIQVNFKNGDTDFAYVVLS